MWKTPRLVALVLMTCGLSPLCAQIGQAPTRFEENRGQWNPRVRYGRRIGPATAWFLDRSMVLDLARQASDPAGGFEGVTLAMHFEGALPGHRPLARQELAGRTHYLRGQDPRRWARGVRGYARLAYPDLYRGISLLFRDCHEARGIVEYDLLLRPGADLRSVVIRCEGVEHLSLGAEGSLLMQTARGTIRQKPPTTWQDLPEGGRERVTCRYRLLDGMRYGFEVEGWDPSLPLTIDPGLVYGSFWGAGGNDAIQDMCVDPKGRVILVGRTASFDFPETTGAWSKKNSYKLNVLWSGFVSCFSADFKTLHFSTYLGGADASELNAVFTNSKQEILVGGSTYSMDYPVTSKAVQATRAGTSLTVPYNSDLVLTKLSADGSTLLYSTYLGGSGIEEACDVHLSDNGIASLVGSAESGFPTTTGSFQAKAPGLSGAAQPLALRLDTVQGSLVYATYVGGSRHGRARGLQVDAQGQLDLVGETRSQDFPTTAGAYKTATTSKSGDDLLEGFFARLSPAGDKLLVSTRIGGTGRDSVAGLMHEASGSLLLHGWSASPDLPTHKGAFQENFAGIGTGPVSYTGDGFVMRLDGTASKVLACTYLGGGEDDEIRVAAKDYWGEIWVMGATGSSSLPVSDWSYKNKYQDPGYRTWKGEVFYARLDDRLELVTHLGYYGGGDTEEVSGLWVDPVSHEILFAGVTRSSTVPLSANAQQRTRWGNYAGYVARIAPSVPPGIQYSRDPSPCTDAISMEPLGPAIEKDKEFDVRVLGAPARSSGFVMMSFLINSKPFQLPLPLGIQWHYQLGANNIILFYPLTSDGRGCARTRIDHTFLEQSTVKIKTFYLHGVFVQQANACPKNKFALSSTRLMRVDIQAPGS